MIKKIKIKNFQSHKNSELLLHKGVNVIVGSSDSGKSAIIRALKWVVFNKPKGDGYRNWEGGDTEVTLETEQSKITRLKSNTENKYFLENRKGTLVFAAFGHDIPKEISDELNIEEVNLQTQSDSPFLISNTSGEVAHHFNKMAGIDKIDYARQKIQSRLNQVTSNIQRKTEQRTELRKSISEFDYLDDLEIKVDDIGKQENLINKDEEKIKNLNKIKSEITDKNNKIQYLEKYIKAEILLNKITALLETKKELNQQIHSIQNQIKKLSFLDKQMSDLKDIEKGESLVDDLMKIASMRNEKNKQSSDLNYLMEKIIYADELIEKRKTKNQEQEQLYKENMKGNCPLCNSKLT